MNGYESWQSNSLSTLNFLVRIQSVRQVEKGQRLTVYRAEKDAAIGSCVFQQYGQKLQGPVDASRHDDFTNTGVVDR